MPAVSLIFPPLVWTGFGSFYPSTAVLSAFLKQHGIGVAQEDLNDEFVDFLIADPMLRELAAGRVAHVRADSVTAAAARWAERNKRKLLDELHLRAVLRAVRHRGAAVARHGAHRYLGADGSAAPTRFAARRPVKKKTPGCANRIRWPDAQPHGFCGYRDASHTAPKRGLHRPL